MSYNKLLKCELFKQNQEMDMVHLIFRLLCDLRISSNKDKIEICRYYMSRTNKLMADHLHESKMHEDIIIDHYKPFNLKHLQEKIGIVSQMDVESTNYVLEVYNELVFEDEMGTNVTFTINNEKWIESDVYTHKMKQLLVKQKAEALLEISKLISKIHYIVEYSDCEAIQEQYLPYIGSIKQNKDLHNIQIAYGKTEKLEGVIALVSKTYYEFINRNEVDLLSMKSRVRSIRVLWNLYKEIESGRFSSETDIRRSRSLLLQNSDLCKGIRI
jgi:hypothetical protein